MEFISEQVIDEVARQLEITPEGYLLAVEELKQKQPVLLAYFLSEDFDLLTESENEYLLYLGIVLWKAAEKVNPDLPDITDEMLDMAEEHNWNLLSQVTASKFRERVTIFFDAYPQEDMLAFVEDALVDDEDTFVSKEGREPLFVALKTVIDVLTQI